MELKKYRMISWEYFILSIIGLHFYLVIFVLLMIGRESIWGIIFSGLLTLLMFILCVWIFRHKILFYNEFMIVRSFKNKKIYYSSIKKVSLNKLYEASFGRFEIELNNATTINLSGYSSINKNKSKKKNLLILEMMRKKINNNRLE